MVFAQICSSSLPPHDLLCIVSQNFFLQIKNKPAGEHLITIVFSSYWITKLDTLRELSPPQCFMGWPCNTPFQANHLVCVYSRIGNLGGDWVKVCMIANYTCPSHQTSCLEKHLHGKPNLIKSNE